MYYFGWFIYIFPVAKNCFNAASVQRCFQEANDRFKRLVVRYGKKIDKNNKNNKDPQPFLKEVCM